MCIRDRPYSARELILSFFFVLAGLVFRGVFTGIIMRTAKALASRTRTEYDDRLIHALEKPLTMFFPILGVYLAFMILSLDEEWARMASLLFRGLTMMLVFWALVKVVDVLIDMAMHLSGGTDNSFYGFAPLVKKSLRIFLIVLGIAVSYTHLTLPTIYSV